METNNPCAIPSRVISIRTDDRVSGSEHQRYIFVGLLRDLQDLGSEVFKEHWWYRAHMWRISTHAGVNPHRQRDWEYLMKRVTEYRRKHKV